MSSFLLRKAQMSEDALTGALADVLAWWPHRAVSLFTRARRFDGTRVLEPSGIPAHAGDLRVLPWPRWPSGEPDLVLEFSHEGGRSLVIIEAKLGASKSSADGEELPESEEAVADQLAKYFIDAIRGRDRRDVPPPERVDVVYLTHHLFPLVADLAASHRVMPRSTPGDLFWLSWHDLERTLQRETATAVGGRLHALRSLGAVLAQQGFSRFSGSWAPPGCPPSPQVAQPAFYTARDRWRGPRPVAAAPTSVFFAKGE